jgi:hypothetical protein
LKRTITGVALAFAIAGGGVWNIAAHDAAAVAHLMAANGAAVSKLDDGRTLITTNVSGDLRGPLTLAFTAHEDGSISGEWALAVSYVQDIAADGTPVADHHHEDGVDSEPAGEILVQRGVLKGTLSGGTLSFNGDGTLGSVQAAGLTITGGTLQYGGIHGGRGFITINNLQDRDASSGSLDLSF